MPELILKATDICKSFPAGDGHKLTVLNKVSLSLIQGESVAITGPSGCGKSTLLSLFGTLEKADSGTLSLGGQSFDNLDENQLAELRLNKIGFVFQKHHLLPQLTALENVLLPTLKSPKNQRAEKKLRAEELLTKVGLQGRLNHRPGELSGGECQRVALCRALINRPLLLLADEPTGALDQDSSAQLVELLLELNQSENMTLITVTHAPGVAEKMATQYELRNGALEKK